MAYIRISFSDKNYLIPFVNIAISLDFYNDLTLMKSEQILSRQCIKLTFDRNVQVDVELEQDTYCLLEAREHFWVFIEVHGLKAEKLRVLEVL